jgi:AsmA protein
VASAKNTWKTFVNAATGFKRLGIACAATVLAGGGFLTAMSQLISVDGAREQAKAEIRLATGLDPVFRGQSTVSLFPFGTISFEDVALGDGRQAALTAQRLTARLRFFPLLLGRIETGEIVLERPSIVVNVDGSGRSNWTHLLESLTRTQSPTTRATPSFSAIRIQDGRVTVRDNAQNLHETFDHVALSLAWPAISKSFGASGHFDWRGETLEVSATLGDFAAALAGKSSALKLRVAGTPGKVAFEGTISTQPTFKLAGMLAADALSLRKVLRWAGAKPPPGGGFERFALKAETNVVGGTIALSGVNIELDDNRAEGVLAFAVDGRRTLQGTLAADRLDLRPYISSVRFVTADKREWSDGHVSLDGMSGFDVDVRLSAASVLLSDAKLDRTAVAANLRGGNLSITIGESQAFGGVIKGAIILSNIRSGIDVKSNLQFNDVDLDTCLNQLFNLKRLEGKGDLTVSVEGSGESILAVTRTLNGSATLTGKTGALVGLNVEQLLRRLERRPLSAGAELHTGRTPFEKIGINVKIVQGKVTVDNVQIEGSAVRLALAGSASIPGRNLDLTGTATLLSASMQDGFELPFVVQGSWDDPIVLPDAQILIRRSGAAAPLLNAVRNRRGNRPAIERPAGVSPATADAAKSQN